MSVFDAIYTWGEHLPTLGLYLFIFAWLFVESTGFPISDEPLLLLAGSLTTTGKLALIPVIVIALVGKVAASCLAYWLGHYVQLERLARPDTQPSTGFRRWLYYIRPTKAFVIATEERARKQGVWGVFLGRLIPVVRSFISYPAGAARMPFPLFLTATTAGSLIWITIWTVLGAVLGNSYKTALQRWGSISIYVLLGVIALAIIAWVWNHRRAEAEALRLQAQRVAEAARKAREQRQSHKHPATKATAPQGSAKKRPAVSKPRR